MSLVPDDYPDRLARAGLRVSVFGDWRTCGGDANHRAVVLHHTASGSSVSPADDAAYCHHGTSDAPLYNVLIGRDGSCWVLTRRKSNSSGKISSVAYQEAIEGRAGAVSASARGLSDGASQNASLFAISAQNNGTGEPWSDALIDAMARCASVTLAALGLSSVGYVTQHRVLTARKIDTCGGNCPYDWQPLIADAGGAPAPKPPPEVRDMWTTHKDCEPGTGRDNPGVLVLGLPANRKSATVTIYCPANPPDGASLWAAVGYVGTKQGLWSGGKTWEYWLPGQQSTKVDLAASAQSVEVHYYGGSKSPVTVTLSGE